MTKGNVGSLLVFDPSKVDLSSEMTKASGDAVVGLITERGAHTAMLRMTAVSSLAGDFCYANLTQPSLRSRPHPCLPCQVLQWALMQGCRLVY